MTQSTPRDGATADLFDERWQHPQLVTRWLRAVGARLTKRWSERQRAADAQSLPPRLLTWAGEFLPHYFRSPPSGMHRWLEREFDQMDDARGLKLNVIGPRGGAKSTVATLAWPLRLALEAREPLIWIISDTKHQACAHLENLKLELLDNRRLAQRYPAAVGRGSMWRDNAIVLPNGVMIQAFGTGQRIRGRRFREHRPTLIICDDLQNDQHMESALQRDHSRRWFHGTLLKAGTARTNIVNLATALHREALAWDLHTTAGWRSHRFAAIEQWPERLDLWAAWEAIYTNLDNPAALDEARAFYDAQRPLMDSGALLLWPEEEDLYTLMRMRVESGRNTFEREKQGSPVNPALCEWPEDYFSSAIWFDAWPELLAVRTLALDPSKGSDATHGDYSAYVALGVDRQGTLYVEADLARRPTSDMVAAGVAWCARFRPDAFGVETNQFQDLLAPVFAEALARQQGLGTAPWPIENHVAKAVRIRRLTPYLSTGRIKFLRGSPGTRLLVEQLRDFPHGDHDDGPDALEMAVRLAAQLLHNRPTNDGLGTRLPVG